MYLGDFDWEFNVIHSVREVFFKKNQEKLARGWFSLGSVGQQGVGFLPVLARV